MLNKGLLLACALALLSACDSSAPDKPAPAPVEPPAQTQDQPAAPAPAAPAAQVEAAKPAPVKDDATTLAKRYAGRELSVVDVSEVQVDGASALALTFSVPLDDQQNFADKVHLVDTVKGKVDGAWELSANKMELRLRHLEPQLSLIHI